MPGAPNVLEVCWVGTLMPEAPSILGMQEVGTLLPRAPSILEWAPWGNCAPLALGGHMGWAAQCPGVHRVGHLDAVSLWWWARLGAPRVGTEMPAALGAGGAWDGHPNAPGELCQAVLEESGVSTLIPSALGSRARLYGVGGGGRGGIWGE